MAHAPPTVIYDRPGSGYYQQLALFQAEAKERIEAAGDFRGGGFRWDRSVKRLGIGWTPACKIPDAKVHIQGDGLPGVRPLGLRVDTDGAFFGDISLSTYTSEAVFFEIATPASTSRSRGFRFAGGAKTSISGGELVDVNFAPANVEYGTGTLLAAHRAVVFSGYTLSATSAKTINSAVTVHIAAPLAGDNVTIGPGTNYFQGPFALNSGPAHFSCADTTTGPAGLKKPPAIISFCRVALTALSSGYEYREFSANVGSSLQWDTAAPATFKSVVINDVGTPLSCTAATVITTAASVYIGGAPTASTNVTITNAYALWVDSGKVKIDGDLVVDGTITAGGVSSIGGTIAAAQVAYGSAANVVAGSNNLVWDNTNARLGIGTSSPGQFLDVRGSSTVDLIRLNNTNAAGLSSLLCYADNGTSRKCGFGYGNASFAGDAVRPGRAFIYLESANLVVTDGTREYIHVGAGTGTTNQIGFNSAPVAGIYCAFAQPVATSGSGIGFAFTGAAHTTLDASASWRGVGFSFNQSINFSTGAHGVGAIRVLQIRAPTITYVGASTATDPTTVWIEGPPVAGTNATFTNVYSLWVDAGRVRIDQAIALGGGAAPTLGTIGGSGPATAAQNEWIEITTQNGRRWVPAWA